MWNDFQRMHILATNEKWYIETFAKVYVKEIVRAHSVPLMIFSDRNSYFTYRFWKGLHEEMGTKLCLSIAYHPQTDGQNERKI